ncbi:MAG: hypothetical protein LBQ44_10310, partial [Treponema sp.]|nr:hypothetical protein [Treponema sp.]
VRAFNNVFSRETADLFEIERADYVIDAIDSLSCKLDLIEITLNASKRGPPASPSSGAGPGSSGSGPRLFSSMGMACKLDPTRLRTADIWETEGCPLARLVRRGLRKRGFTGHFTVVYSDEVLPPAAGEETVCGGGGCFCTDTDNEWCSSKKTINGSAVTVTAAAGMVLAGLVIRDIYDRTAAARSVRG